VSDPQKPAVKLPDPKKVAEGWSRIIGASKRLVRDYLDKQSRGEAPRPPDTSFVASTFVDLAQKMMAQPGRVVDAQMTFWRDYMALFQSTAMRVMGQKAEPVVRPEDGDRRFRDPEWAESALFDFIKQSYLLTARCVQDSVQVEGLDPKARARVELYTRQFVDALSPTNFAPTNPAVLKATMESGGENLVQGLANLLEDVERGGGSLRVRTTDLSAFEVGKNLAITPGKVVFQSALMQLIQYAPATPRAYRRPLLVVPPWINKYYVLDLSPKNSFVRWAVERGHTVFVISWVNPDARLSEKAFEDYLTEGTLATLDAIERATGEREVDAVGYCLGGTLLMCTLGWLAAGGDERVRSATCFTTLTDFAEPGELSVFIDEEHLELIEREMNEKGYLDGAQMAGAFSLLRANDLIWSFVVNNYLLGKEPMPFDVLYWGSDSTRMPRKMHAYYLRNMYQHNRLKDPGGLTLAGRPIDLRRVTVPLYFLSTREDHIAPWRSTYAGTQLVSGPVRFVLGGSGHIAGVVNPASSKKYGYATNEATPATPDEWLAGSVPHEGSWWTDWHAWLTREQREEVPAREPGGGALPALEDAPGSYVRVRI
jgi:polyhydroxyalkanoate synthase